MHGPITANILFSLLPFFLKQLITLIPIFLYAPFHPTCAAPIIFFLGSKKRIGAQSAVKIPIAILLDLVIKPSPNNFFLDILFMKKTLLL